MSSFKIGRIAGIQIGVHHTWRFALFLVAWSLAQGLFPANYRGWDEATYWVLDAITAGLPLFRFENSQLVGHQDVVVQTEMLATIGALVSPGAPEAGRGARMCQRRGHGQVSLRDGRRRSSAPLEEME